MSLTSARSLVSVRVRWAARRLAPAQDVPLMITGVPRAAQRLHEGVTQFADVQAHRHQLRQTGQSLVPVIGVGKLVEVGADLAEMAKEPRQFLAFDRRAA